jgi:D-3-phosphoglycerate dehydrogenase
VVAAEQRKIAVVYQPDYATSEVATHAVAMLLALNRKLSDGDAIARHDWQSRKSRLAGLVALEALTIGVVGCGHIGRAVIDRLRPFGARILAFDTLAAGVPAGVERVSNFDVLLQRCDVLTLHLPLTATTSALIDARALGQLRNGALLVNVARGGLIDETAVAAALASGALGGYAADAFVHEPFRADGPLASAPNTLFSPHIAWLSQTSVVRLRTWTLDGVLQFLRTGSVVTGRIAGATTANTVGQSNAGLSGAEPGCI